MSGFLCVNASCAELHYVGPSEFPVLFFTKGGSSSDTWVDIVLWIGNEAHLRAPLFSLMLANEAFGSARPIQQGRSCAARSFYVRVQGRVSFGLSCRTISKDNKLP